MHRHFIVLFVLIVVMVSVGCSKKETEDKTKSINPNATEEASNLLEFLYDISGKQILTGHHHSSRSRVRYVKDIEEMTGKTPVVWGNDFSFNYESQEDASINRQAIVDTAIILSKQGHIITLMWHACYPTDGDTCGGSSIWRWADVVPQDEWNSITTAGTSLNNMWREQADRVAGYLKQLQDAKVPILWRPYHEMNGIWFWWCNHPGDNGYSKLWKMMYDYFTNHHKLNNLIWVWNANAPRDKEGDEAYAYADYFPGLEYVDVLAADVYHNDYRQSHHDQLVELAKGKPIALGEVGRMPTPEILATQPNWTWFMGWANWLFKANQPYDVKTLYQYEKAVSMDKIQKDENGKFKIIK